ncbi:YtfJ family protein [Polyangium sp. 6x1]|uniref:YtfJ family protein n=1 Tax=Polyangium sp. 6x1 TaxID=3042689 RepID=UPI002482481C|nr:YtfJ family protein [Polyangium sp. 6x1]MDI1450671.1 YtfJ family protein [Polyangium sp. 6x1]
MRSRGKASKVISAIVLGAALVPGVSLALPKEGAEAPNARVEDADGRALQMSSLKGKPILIMYEDKDSAAQNQPLKDDLAKLGQGDKYKQKVAIAAIADVSSYDFWPAKGFVKDAIREESKKQKTTIYCDWDGSFRKAYGIRKGASNVILVGKDGRVLFAGSGALGTGDRKKLIELLGAQVEG